MIKEIKTPKELLDYMSNNIKYGYLGKNGKVYHFGDKNFNENWYNEYVLQSETMLEKTGYGNCFDQVELERSWFIDNGYEIKSFFEIVSLEYKNDYPSHSFLVYKDGNSWCWFENADFDNMGIHSFSSLDELLDYQYKKYLELLKKYNISKEEIDKIIITEFDKPLSNISASEYLNYVSNSKRVYLK